MYVQFLHGLLLILGLFRHGISVPIASEYFLEDTQNQDFLANDITEEADSYERDPRDVFSAQYFMHGNRLFPRNRISARPTLHRKHYHLFHLTATHPNAVSYHVIEKPLATRSRTITGEASKRFEDSLQSNVPYNTWQYHSYPMQYYSQQPAMYQQQGYPSPSLPYSQTPVYDTTYQDILQEASTDPMPSPRNPSSYFNQQTTAQNDDMNSLEKAAKQFKLASADMNNMELASLVMFPVPHFHDDHHDHVHKKKTKLQQNSKKDKKKNKKKVSKVKFHTEPKTVNNLVHKLIKNDKDKDDEDQMEDKGSGSGSGSRDTWDEEDVATSDEEGYTSSKRSEIPHVLDTVSESDEDKTESTSDDDKKKKEHSSQKEGVSGQDQSEFRSGDVRVNQEKDADSDDKKDSPKSEQNNVKQGPGNVENDENSEGSRMQDATQGSNHISEGEIKDDDVPGKSSDDSSKKQDNKKSEE